MVVRSVRKTLLPARPPRQASKSRSFTTGSVRNLVRIASLPGARGTAVPSNTAGDKYRKNPVDKSRRPSADTVLHAERRRQPADGGRPAPRSDAADCAAKRPARVPVDGRRRTSYTKCDVLRIARPGPADVAVRRYGRRQCRRTGRRPTRDRSEGRRRARGTGRRGPETHGDRQTGRENGRSRVEKTLQENYSFGNAEGRPDRSKRKRFTKTIVIKKKNL